MSAHVTNRVTIRVYPQVSLSAVHCTYDVYCSCIVLTAASERLQLSVGLLRMRAGRTFFESSCATRPLPLT